MTCESLRPGRASRWCGNVARATGSLEEATSGAAPLNHRACPLYIVCTLPTAQRLQLCACAESRGNFVLRGFPRNFEHDPIGTARAESPAEIVAMGNIVVGRPAKHEPQR